MRDSDTKFACEPRSELILACFANNAACRNFSNFAFYATKLLSLVRNANKAMRISQVCMSLNVSKFSFFRFFERQNDLLLSGKTAVAQSQFAKDFLKGKDNVWRKKALISFCGFSRNAI